MTSLPTEVRSLTFLDVKSSQGQVSLEELFQRKSPTAPYWVHFSIDDVEASSWLKDGSGVEAQVVEAMLAQKTRPKLISQPSSILLILRVADTLEASEHEELRSLRIYVARNRIISTSLYPLPVIKELTEKWQLPAKGSAHVVDLFMDLTIQSIRGLEAILEDLEDQADDLEHQVLDDGEDPEDSEIATLSLDALALRRCLGPQKEVLARIADSEVTWLGEPERKRLRGIHERVSRQLDETEVIRDRARIIREQRNGHVAEQVNQRLYVFSVVAVIFLPLGFLTGLLGVNLGGIPGADSPIAFGSFCGALFTLTLATTLLFRKFRWL